MNEYQTRPKVSTTVRLDARLRRQIELLAAARGTNATNVITAALEAEIAAAIERNELEKTMAELFGGPPVQPVDQNQLAQDFLARVQHEGPPATADDFSVLGE